MTHSGSDFGHAVIWLIIGGFCELLSVLVTIWMILEYEVSFFTQHPFLTGFTIAGIGFAFSLVCILYAMMPKGPKCYNPKTYGAKIMSNSPLYQLNAKGDHMKKQAVDDENAPRVDSDDR